VPRLEARGDAEDVTANTHAIRQEATFETADLAQFAAPKSLPTVVAQPGSYRMRHARRLYQHPRWRPGCGRNVAPRTASLHADHAARQRCRRHRPSRYAFPRGPRVTGPQAGRGPRLIGPAGLRVKRIARASFFSHGSLLTRLGSRVGCKRPSARLARALEREPA
jgi:hypothetical protein